ncbi:MAG TPA: chemotaxis protein CheW [Myxococcota bacterium]|nr:chemotaxis protein CheW [Myxococcota bacterium]
MKRALGDQAIADDVEPEAEFLCVRLRDRRYAIPIGQVAEVLSPTTVTRVPHMPSHVRGVFNRHGKITAVLDLAAFSAIETEESPKRLVVLQHDQLEAAVPVSEVIGLVQVRLSQIEPPLAHLSGELAFVTGQIDGDDGILSVLDARILLENSRVRRG